jgi:xylulokinase
MGELLIGVDLGTTATKTALYEPDGTELASATAQVPLRWSGPGEVDQDPEQFVATTTTTIGECVRSAGVAADSVAGIAITGQMAGTMGIDADWRPSTPYDSWLDTRCSDDVEALDREVGDELVALAGCPAMVNHAAKIRWWRRTREEDFERTAAWMPPSSFVSGRLCGLDAGSAFIDRSYLHFTGLADAHAGVWSAALADAVGVAIDRLPRIVEPTEVVGELSAASASECGVSPGIPVAAGLGDTAAAVLGAGIVRPGQLLDTAGTAAVLAISTAEHRPDTDDRTLIVMRGALPDQWVALSYLSGGGLFDWLAQALGGEGAEDELEYRRLGEIAETAPPGSQGLVFVPHLDGRLLPNEPQLRGAWLGLDRRHRREHLVRAVHESVAYEYALYLRVMRRLHPELEPDAVRVVGGGARSAPWCRIKASVMGLPYVRLERDEFSCWGAALVAGAAVGILPDLAAAAETATAERERCEPDEGSADTYGEMVGMYERALEALRQTGSPSPAEVRR